MKVLDWEIPYHKHFEEMCHIPHGSFNEKRYSNYLVEFAKKHNLKYIQDEMYNVIIYKPASAGYEAHEPVILQAHMDMVCAKTPESRHDFTKDSLELYVEDGFLKARNTTLGADDGVGVAYMLSVLESENLKHPALECVFTVQEESGCNGAAVLKKEYFSARRMIGLDDVGGGTSYVTTAGSQIVRFGRKLIWEETTNPVYELEVKGLLSGHSGVDINKERGNAIKLAIRFLYELQKMGGIWIAEAVFGVAENVIPASGKLKFATDIPFGQMMETFEKCYMKYFKELEFSDANLEMSLLPAYADRVVSAQDSREIIQFFYYLPNGMQHQSMRFEDLPVASCNIGTLFINQDGMIADECQRGALPSYIEDMEEIHKMLCNLYHMEREITGVVAPFDYIENSPIRNKLAKVFCEMTGRELIPVFIHGGIEAGYFKQLYPEMDIVTIGPLVLDEHMVTERLDLKSFDEIWEVLVKMLEEL